MSVKITCYRCKVEFWMTDEFYRVAKQAAEVFYWYCPNGHQQTFAVGESEEVKLRRERDSLKQRLAEWQEYAEASSNRANRAERKAAAARGQVTKLKNRAAKGVCPCCNRHFTNLERHMASQHPGFIAEPTADEHVN